MSPLKSCRTKRSSGFMCCFTGPLWFIMFKMLKIMLFSTLAFSIAAYLVWKASYSNAKFQARFLKPIGPISTVPCWRSLLWNYLDKNERFLLPPYEMWSCLVWYKFVVSEEPFPSSEYRYPKIQAVGLYETSRMFFHTTRCYIPDDRHLRYYPTLGTAQRCVFLASK
jgi:hypothetical protein